MGRGPNNSSLGLHALLALVLFDQLALSRAQAAEALRATKPVIARTKTAEAADLPCADASTAGAASTGRLWSGKKLPISQASLEALPFARLANAAYSTPDKTADGWRLKADWTAVLADALAISNPKAMDRLARLGGRSGFSAAIYEKGGRFVLTFRGTEGTSDASDWVTNVEQATGLRVGNQYDFALRIVRAAQHQYGDDLVLTGHSLGGGLAQYSAWKFPALRAITFNAAPIARTPSSAGNLPNVVNVVVDRDPVSSLSGRQLGYVTYIIPNPISAPNRDFVDQAFDGLTAHGGVGAKYVVDALVLASRPAARRSDGRPEFVKLKSGTILPICHLLDGATGPVRIGKDPRNVQYDLTPLPEFVAGRRYPDIKYQISYDALTSRLSVIVSRPVVANRSLAEQFLMDRLGIHRKDLCDLNASVASEVDDGGLQEIGFSGCSAGATLPQAPFRG